MKLIIYWNNKIKNLLIIIFSYTLLAQDGEIIEITKHIGYTLDAEENLHYKVFNDIPNFESAQFFEKPHQKIEAQISFVEYTNIKTSRRSFDLKEFSDMQFRLKKNPQITDEIRDSFRKNLTYLRTKSVLQNIPKGQYLSVKHRNGIWIRGTLLNFRNDRLLIQTPFSIKQIPITKMERLTYREKIIAMPEWKISIYGFAALLGLGIMEIWNRQASPNWGYKWHNRFIGGIFGLVAGAEVYDVSMILLTKKTHFGLTPEELDKLNR